METLQKIALVPTIIGALNWGLIGAFNFNLVTAIFNEGMLANIVYIVVALCGLVNILLLFMHIQKDPD